MHDARDEVITKLRQIEEQVKALLGESPERLAADRLRLISGLAGYLRTHVQLHWPHAAANAEPAQGEAVRPPAVRR